MSEGGQFNPRSVLPTWLEGIGSVGSHGKNLNRPQDFLRGDIWRHRGLRETGRTRAGMRGSSRVAAIEGGVARNPSTERKSL